MPDYNNPMDRGALMGEILSEFMNNGYQYSLGSGSPNFATLPPPPRTAINCQAAARIAIKMAEKEGMTGLVVVAAAPPDGFLTVVQQGILAFGSNQPPINDGGVLAWEFDNHYRVKDTSTGIVYDPTFGTGGKFNPRGVKASGPTTSPNPSTMISYYGDKYQVTRQGMIFKVKVLSDRPVEDRFWLDNGDFT